MSVANRFRDTTSFNSSSRLQEQFPPSTPRSLSQRSYKFKPTSSSKQTLLRVPSKSPIKQIIHLSKSSKSPIKKRVVQVPVGTSYEVLETLNLRFLDFEKSIKQRLSKLEQRSRLMTQPIGDY